MLLRPGYLLALRRTTALTPPPTPPLAVTATVEDNGWVLAVRGTWGSTLTGGSWRRPDGSALAWNADRYDAQWRIAGVDQFPLDPGGAPKIVVNLQSAGFDRSGGQAVFNAARTRQVVATRPLRLPYQGSGVDCPLDETDHGDGTRTIRFALSDRVYSTCTIASVAFTAGWKVGQLGGLATTAVNNSTRTAPLPIFRYVCEPWPYSTGVVRPELLVATHHPEHFGSKLHQACAAVKWTFSDGTTVVERWVSEDAVSPLYGDNLLCWTAPIDLTGSGLNPGPVTAWPTVYPWIGPSRTMNPAPTGTAAEQHSTSETAALGPTWGTPFHFWFDPGGAIWPKKFVAIDPVGGTTTAASVVWQSSEAAANAAAASTKPANFVTACRAVASGSGGGVTLPARNGFGSHAACGAWWEVLLPEGVSAPTADLSGTPRSGPGYLIVRGNPNVANPRTSCVLQSGAAQRTWNSLNRMKFMDLRLELGTVEMFNCSVAPTTEWISLENVDIRLKSGGTDGFAVFNGVAHTSHFNVDARNINTTGQQVGWLFRNVNRTALMTSSSLVAAAINVRINLPQAGDVAPSRTGGIFNSGSPNNDDLMLWNCEVYGAEGTLLTARQATFGTDEGSYRWALVNVMAEGTAGTGELLVIGETVSTTLKDSVIENLTFVGNRWNWHNDCEILSSVSNGAAVRVNLSSGLVVRVGLMNHGMSTGDTINVSGFTGTNGTRLNVTGATVTVLDAHRFEYSIATAVTSTSNIGGNGTVTYVTGAMAGQPARPIIRHNLRHTGNVMRNSVHCRNGTKHDLFNAGAHLTGSWELSHGVGFRGNVTANRGTASPAEFQYAYFGIGSEAEYSFGGGGQTEVASYGVGWHGYVDDNSRWGPDIGSHTNGGDYRADPAVLAPFKPSRLLNKGMTPGVTDRTGRNAARGSIFDAGALGRA